MKKLIYLIVILFICQSNFAQSEKESPFEWSFDVGFETGKFKIPSIDDGDYQSPFIGTRLGFNLRRVFLGLYGKLGSSSFNSNNPAGQVNRIANPLPEDGYTLWGPTIAYKFPWVHIYYSYLLESHKFDGEVLESGTPSNLTYRYEGVGHEVGIGFRLFGNVFLTYHYRMTELDEFKRRVDGSYSELMPRSNSLNIDTHVIGIRVPISLHKLPGMFRDFLLK